MMGGADMRKYSVFCLLLLTIFFAVVFTTGCAETSSAQSESPNKNISAFDDVKDGAWYKDDVAFVKENGLMSGTDSNKFSPDISTSRGMIVTILNRLDGSKKAGHESGFFDVKEGSYYQNAVNWAAENNIVKGYSNTEFGPNDRITREQMAAILYRYSEYKGYNVSLSDEKGLNGFSDYKTVSEYAITPMSWAVEKGLIKGLPDNTVNPKGEASRAQVAAIMHRFCELNSENPGSKPDEKPTFNVESKTAKKDSEVEIKVSLKNNPGIASIAMFVTYDQDLTLKKVTYNNKIEGEFMKPADLYSPVKLTWISPFKEIEGDFEFATLTFKTDKNISKGNYPVCITYEPDDVYDMSETNITFEINNGAVIIE